MLHEFRDWVEWTTSLDGELVVNGLMWLVGLIMSYPLRAGFCGLVRRGPLSEDGQRIMQFLLAKDTPDRAWTLNGDTVRRYLDGATELVVGYKGNAKGDIFVKGKPVNEQLTKRDIKRLLKTAKTIVKLCQDRNIQAKKAVAETVRASMRDMLSNIKVAA